MLLILLGRHNYTQPVNFISSGQQGDREGEETGDEDSDYGEQVG